MYHLLSVWIHHHSCQVVNDPVPHEQHCKNDESDTVLFDDQTQLIESEVAEDAEKRDVFDFFAEFVLSSNQIIELLARGCVMFSLTREFSIKFVF